ncbi:olfactory receptor 5AR1-like [Maylandia zebra]|uniref:olfactory receptor 5AR1-like n=1 Tax=Maylandia zebra TaxID=106582 RepID=UPI00403D5368
MDHVRFLGPTFPRDLKWSPHIDSIQKKAQQSLFCYCIICLLNVSLIVIIILDSNLHESMYILLCVFCINALYGTAGFFPKFLWDLLSDVHLISYYGCLIQTKVIYSFLCGELSILALMAYDRYVAICQPLKYHSIMSKQRVISMRLGSKELPRTLQNFVAIEVLVIPPIMNPLIYGFKLTKIRKKIYSVVILKGTNFCFIQSENSFTHS